MTAFPMSPQPKPSRAGFWIGGALILLAIIVGIAGVVVGLMGINDTVDGFDRAPIRSGGTLVFREAGTYDAYLERDGIDAVDSSSTPYGSESLVLVREGNIVPLLPDRSGEFTYSFGDRDGRRIGRFEILQPGSHELRGVPAAPGDDVLAVGQGDPDEGFIAIGVGVFAGFALGIVGVVVLVVSIVRRNRSGRPPTGYPGATGPGAWMPPPAPGHPGAAPGWVPPVPGGPPPVPPPGTGWPPAGPGGPVGGTGPGSAS